MRFFMILVGYEFALSELMFDPFDIIPIVALALISFIWVRNTVKNWVKNFIVHGIIGLLYILMVFFFGPLIIIFALALLAMTIAAELFSFFFLRATASENHL